MKKTTVVLAGLASVVLAAGVTAPALARNPSLTTGDSFNVFDTDGGGIAVDESAVVTRQSTWKGGSRYEPCTKSSPDLCVGDWTSFVYERDYAGAPWYRTY